MRRGNKNVKVLRKFFNDASGIKTELTRKMRIDGTIAYYVVVTRTDTGEHIRITPGDGLQKAYALYMRASGTDNNYPLPV